MSCEPVIEQVTTLIEFAIMALVIITAIDACIEIFKED